MMTLSKTAIHKSRLNRRLLLQGTIGTAAISMAVSCGLLYPGRVLATLNSPWNKEAFSATNLQTAIKSTLGSDLTRASDKISIKAPDVAENGAVVPITVTSSLKNVRTITLLSEKNATPLVARFDLDNDTQAFISTRIKMSTTSNVIAIVTAGDNNFSVRKEVKVTIGGCGG